MKEGTLPDSELLQRLPVIIIHVNNNIFLFTLLRIVFPLESSFSQFWGALDTST